MREFFIVLRFELMGILKSKAFVLSTVIIGLLLAIGLSVPTIIDTFSTSDTDSVEDISQEVSDQVYGYINENQAITNIEDLKTNFMMGQLKEFSSQQELEKNINDGDINAGFIIQTPTKYQYIIQNNEMINSDQMVFEQALLRAYQIQEFETLGVEYSEVVHVINPMIESETEILGKDSASNYTYTYILIFALYFIIIVYGQMVATSVASEKSNRAMEVLITSTDSRNLIFGKVLGVGLAGIIQFALILILGRTFYDLNANAWDSALDFVFDIPVDVLLTFSVFGILGYLFYTFIFGALGALVSRTEDVSASSTPITILFIGVFFIAMMGMYNTESLLLKVTSFIPFSSFMSMFIRVSMGSVSNIEVILSLGILGISTIIIGLIASRIYRMGTLMYGNPVKIKHAFKLIRKK